MVKDLVALVQMLVDNGYLPDDFMTLSEDDLENYNTIEEKINSELLPDVYDTWTEFAVNNQQGNKTILVMDKEQGIESAVREALSGMEDEQVVNLLGRVSNDFEQVLQDWNWKLDDVGNYYINESKEIRGTKERIMASVKKTAGGKGIGNYRRGDVLTQAKSVQPGQLLVLDSITYKATNLVKVTQVFDNKFYAIFVNPENPAEKRQTSDEEFVVHVQDLERGEYYIALEPSPKAVSEEVVEDIKSPVDDTPTPEVPVEEASTEEKPNVEASIKTGSVSRDELMSKLRDLVGEDFHIKKGEEFDPKYEGVIWTSGEEYSKELGEKTFKGDPDLAGLVTEDALALYSEDYTNPLFKKLLDESGWHWEWYDPGTILIYNDHTEEVVKETAGKKIAIQSPVSVQRDYGMASDLVQERIKALASKKAGVEKQAYGEEPASAGDTPSANPITVDDPTHSDTEPNPDDMQDIAMTTFSKYKEQTRTAEFDDEDVPEVAMVDDNQESEYTLEYISQEEHEDEKIFSEEEDLYDAIVITYPGALGTYPTALYQNSEVASGAELDDLADDIKEFIDRLGYGVEIYEEQERGEVQPLMLQKRGVLDNFELESKPNTIGDYAGVAGSGQSFASVLFAELDTKASAPGGLGDDGSAYDLLGGGGRNFTGVNEEDVEVVASQYIEGKAVSFANLDDFIGFIGDAYGVETQASSEFQNAWHADDTKALAALIVKHATKNELQ